MINEIVDALLNTGSTNVRGIASAYFIDLAFITSMPDVKARLKSFNAQMSVSDIVLASGGAILPLSNDNQVSTEFKEDEKGNVQNPFYAYQLNLIFGNDTEDTRGQYIRSFDNRQWIILLQESTGAWRVLGAPARGCDFTAGYDSGTQVKGQALFKISFHWESGYRAFYLAAPDFGVISISSASYYSGWSIIHIDLSFSSFTGTQSGILQIYTGGRWQVLDTYTVPNGAYTSSYYYPLTSGTYYLRIINSDGVASNTWTLTV